MSNPVILVHDAGYGTTPACPQAKFKIGNVVRRRRVRWLAGYPDTCIIAAVVPPGFPPEYAHADAAGLPRPLMVSEGKRYVQYIVGFVDRPAPALVRETALLPSDEPDSTVSWTAP